MIRHPKERAEHIMIVDMARNDIGRVCVYGSVRPDELMVIEQYSHVFHIVSNIVGTLMPGRDCFDLLAATFPGASITGVPKVRCMEIIDELEPVRRGPYTGSLGWISYAGDVDLNIIIRTFLTKSGHAYIQVGGGVVADSVPEREYQETLHKAQALIEAIRSGEKM
jgi:anthranilate/para-aminobenzoate synthase component I